MSDPVCELPAFRTSDEEVRRILAAAKVIAVVGLSERPERDSYRVASYLQERGYRVVPINPKIEAWRGEPAYADLRQARERIDVVGVFRRPEALPGIVEDAIAIGARCVWMQEGIVHNAAAERARRAGLSVVMDRCMMKEHRLHGGGPEGPGRT